MIVDDLMDLFVDKDFMDVDIYDLTSNSVIYSGPYSEINTLDNAEQIMDAEICSLDNIDIKAAQPFTINIEL